jgi:hypothetical protein
MDNGSSGFFTLTELQERLNIADRKNLRTSLIREGAPHVHVGREIFFANDSFVTWLHENEQRTDRGKGGQKAS